MNCSYFKEFIICYERHLNPQLKYCDHPLQQGSLECFGRTWKEHQPGVVQESRENDLEGLSKGDDIRTEPCITLRSQARKGKDREHCSSRRQDICKAQRSKKEQGRLPYQKLRAAFPVNVNNGSCYKSFQISSTLGLAEVLM